MRHEMFLAVTLPAQGEPDITAWDDFPAALAAATAVADERNLIEATARLGSRVMRRWTGSGGDQVIVYAAPYEQET